MMLFLCLLLFFSECQLQITVGSHRINYSFTDASQVDNLHVELIDEDSSDTPFSHEENPPDDLLEINLNDLVNLGGKV